MLLREGGFEAHKWCSNSDDALKGVPHELCESNSSFKIDANDTIRALGLEWKPNSDRLQFTTNILGHLKSIRGTLSLDI